MRYLIRNFDLDDARWLVLVVLAVSLFTSWDHTRALEQRVAAIETSAARAREPEPEPIELREVEEERLPTATEWGNGSMCVDADDSIMTAEGRAWYETRPILSVCR